MAESVSSQRADDKTLPAEETGAAKAELPGSRVGGSCEQLVELTASKERANQLSAFCSHSQKIEGCDSSEGRPIPHYERISQDPRGTRILVFGLIHGDEPLAGELVLEWAERLRSLDNPRSSWRIIPLLNPDGLVLKSRLNSRGVDLNRNFPTRDWADSALDYWAKRAQSDPRRYPGESAASEAETRCAVKHIKEFKPAFVISAHTPYKVLDFDGPKMRFPPYRDLPWRALGNFPGSLGRYLWKDHGLPVLTVELGSNRVDAERLQDIIGSFAIEAVKISGTKSDSLFDLL